MVTAEAVTVAAATDASAGDEAAADCWRGGGRMAAVVAVGEAAPRRWRPCLAAATADGGGCGGGEGVEK
jgi:hypothetical protein